MGLPVRAGFGSTSAHYPLPIFTPSCLHFFTQVFPPIPNGAFGKSLSLEQMIYNFFGVNEKFNAVRGLLCTVEQVMGRDRTGIEWIGGEWNEANEI